VALDGLGYGTDGTFWGGEFLLADYLTSTRLGTFKPVALLGGSQAMREPWRNAYAHIMSEMGWPRYVRDFEKLELTTFLETKPLITLNSMLASGLQVPLASSCGRLFDAVAAAVGICRENVTYEGQAAVELESALALNIDRNDLGYPFAILPLHETGILYIEPVSMWQALLDDIKNGRDRGIISARFHKGLVNIIVNMVRRLTTNGHERWLSTVALSGGVFQNKTLLTLLKDELTKEGFKILTHRNVPSNDGGLSLGQAAISAAIEAQSKEQPNVSWHTRPNC